MNNYTYKVNFNSIDSF
ncbi:MULTISPECIES: putative translational regulatory protein ArgL [Pectobacterium]